MLHIRKGRNHLFLFEQILCFKSVDPAPDPFSTIILLQARFLMRLAHQKGYYHDSISLVAVSTEERR